MVLNRGRVFIPTWPGPMAVSTPEKPGKALFIIDMMEEKLPAEVRLYGMLAVRTSWPYGPGQYETFPKWGDVWTLCYAEQVTEQCDSLRIPNER